MADSRMIKYYRVLRKLSHLLGKHGGTLLFKKSMPFLFVATMSSLLYLLCLKLGAMDFFQSLLSKMGCSLGVRALSFVKIGFPAGLILTFAVRALLATEAAPFLGNMMLPAGAPSPDLELRLGPPGGEVGDDLSTLEERRVKERLALYQPEKEISLDDVQALVQLKGDIISRMAELDPHPFWIERRDRIIAESILTPQGPEYRLETLTKKLEELRGENASNGHFFNKLKKMRENFLLTDRFE